MDDWLIFRGSGTPHDGIKRRPAPPPWRQYRSVDGAPPKPTFQVTPEVIQQVNAALFLHRPLLITGKPGLDKSSVAQAVAHELNLGEVLDWPINTRSTLEEGLYRYDAVGRLQTASFTQATQGRDAAEVAAELGKFLRLGPLGTAMLPNPQPRVLLIDEIDKSDIDLPNDLLHIFEKGTFEIPELSRLGEAGSKIPISPWDNGPPVTLKDGKVVSSAFPLVFLTSNGERDFPAAFMRRCLHLRMEPPSRDKLEAIVKAHLGEEVLAQAAPLIDRFLKNREAQDLSTDQLLNALYISTRVRSEGASKEAIIDSLLQRVSASS